MKRGGLEIDLAVVGLVFAVIAILLAVGCGSVATSAMVTPDAAAADVDAGPDAVTPDGQVDVDVDAGTDADCSRQCRVPQGVTCCLCATPTGDTCCSNLGFAGECCGAGC